MQRRAGSIRDEDGNKWSQEAFYSFGSGVL